MWRSRRSCRALAYPAWRCRTCAPLDQLGWIALTVNADRGRRQRADGAATRARVLDAVVESILDKGYYRTSSNEIARRAGVTWGTLQHQFGSRELLLLEVLNQRWHDLQHE